MKRKKQIDESKNMIASALVKLLAESEYEDLTLSEIADHAGVTRMTLYRHFGSKEKIVLYRAQKSLEEQAARVAGESQPIRALIYERLEWLRTLPQLPILLRSREIEELLEEFSIELHRSRIEQAIGRRFEQDPYLFHFYFGGLNRVIREWLQKGCRESSREITDRIVGLTRAFVLSNQGVPPGSAS